MPVTDSVTHSTSGIAPRLPKAPDISLIVKGRLYSSVCKVVCCMEV